MLKENDQAEILETGETGNEQFKANEAAERRVLEYRNDLLNCEHAGNLEKESVAIDRSARIMERWEQTEDPVARRYMLERVGREMLNVHEAAPPPVSLMEMPRGVLGQHVDADFRIDMDEKQMKDETDPHKALVTYLHEYRHAEQHEEVQKSKGALAHFTDPERSSAVEYNLDPKHYIDGEKNFDAYEQQLIETDARKFATETANKIMERREELRQLGEIDSHVTSDSDRVAQLRLAAERRNRS